MNRLRQLGILGLLALALVQTACIATSAPLSGVVLDRSTGKPLEGAIVVAHWRGDVASPAHSQSMCYHVESVTTDSKGRFHIPRFFGGPWYLTNRHSYVAGVYKEGYREVEYKDTKEPEFQEAPRGVEYLIPFASDANKRLAYLKIEVVRLSCSEAGKSQINEFPAFKAIYEEAKALTNRESDDGTLQWFREMAAGAWVGIEADVPMEEYEQQMNEFLKDHLK